MRSCAILQAQSQGAPPYCQCSRSRETYTLTPMTSTLAVEYLQRCYMTGDQLRLPGAQRYGHHGKLQPHGRQQCGQVGTEQLHAGHMPEQKAAALLVLPRSWCAQLLATL